MYKTWFDHKNRANSIACPFVILSKNNVEVKEDQSIYDKARARAIEKMDQEDILAESRKGNKAKKAISKKKK